MSIRLNPYVNFRGQAGEAMAFYQSVLGGRLDLNTFAEFGGMGVPEAEKHQVMHSQLTVNDTLVLMGSDVPSTMPAEIANGVLSISGEEFDVISDWCAALGDGGTIDVPFEKAPWGDFFGQVTDKFGVTWMFNSGSGED